MERARDVKISTQAAEILAAQLVQSASLSSVPWDTRYHFFDGTEKTINWLIALDAINFSFWPDEGEARWRIRHEGEWLDGYNALAAAMKRGVEEGFAIWDASFLSSLSSSRLRYILRGEGGIPIFEARLRHLRETGLVLLKKFRGSGAQLVLEAKHSAISFVGLLVKHFPSFRDAASYGGIKIPFYKRAQLLACDIHNAFSGESFGDFRDMKLLTAFADYKVPQILRSYGILVYSKNLAKKVEEKKPLKSGSAQEIEIRAATIVAVEFLSESLQEKGLAVFPFDLDGWLWRLSQTNRGGLINVLSSIASADCYRDRVFPQRYTHGGVYEPYHRVRSIYY